MKCSRCNNREVAVQLKGILDSYKDLIIDKYSTYGLGDPEDYLCSDCAHDVYLALKSNARQDRNAEHKPPTACDYCSYDCETECPERIFSTRKEVS